MPLQAKPQTKSDLSASKGKGIHPKLEAPPSLSPKEQAAKNNTESNYLSGLSKNKTYVRANMNYITEEDEAGDQVNQGDVGAVNTIKKALSNHATAVAMRSKAKKAADKQFEREYKARHPKG